MNPAVSIIIPTYNNEHTIGHAIESVLNQTCQDFELIIVDDGSCDSTIHKIATFRNRLHYLHIAHSGLPAVARNAGIRLARGKYLAFLDADDRWLPGRLERHLAMLDSNPDIGLLCANAYIVDEFEAEVYTRTFAGTEKREGGSTTSRLLQDCFICTSSVIIPREILHNAGWFHEDPRLRSIEDFDLWLRISSLAPVRFDPEPLVVYWDHNTTSVRGRNTPMEACRGFLLMLDRFRGFLQKHDQAALIPEEVWQERYTHYYYLLFANIWTAGAFSCLPAFGWEVLRRYPFSFIKQVARRLFLRTMG